MTETDEERHTYIETETERKKTQEGSRQKSQTFHNSILEKAPHPTALLYYLEISHTGHPASGGGTDTGMCAMEVGTLKAVVGCLPHRIRGGPKL